MKTVPTNPVVAPVLFGISTVNGEHVQDTVTHAHLYVLPRIHYFYLPRLQ
jgi:hypothetical protein